MKFQVFDKGVLCEKFHLCGHYMFGSDGIALRKATISFDKGIIDCQITNTETAGLTLLWPIEGFGKVILPTSLLAEREKPYVLNVEIARAKLMQIINKREEWASFNQKKESNGVFAEAQKLFISAVQNLDDPPLASKLADQALKKAAIFSEELACDQAERIFLSRKTNRGFGKGCMGCKVDLERIAEPEYLEKLLALFNFVTIPINWGKIETKRGNYDFSAIDNAVRILARKKVVLEAGPILCFSPEMVPGWLIKNKPGFEKIREIAYEFVAKIVSRYDSLIKIWRVVSDLNSVNHFEFTFEQTLEMTRAATMAVKEVSQKPFRIIEISDPWGEYYANNPSTIPPLVYIDMIIQSGVNFEAFGLKIIMGKDGLGMRTRDLMHISSALDYFTPVAKPLHITEIQLPSESSAETEDGPAGVWRAKWNDQLHRQWIEQFYKIAFSKPFVNSITYSNLVDSENNIIPSSGLLTADLKPKSSYQALQQFKKMIFKK